MAKATRRKKTTAPEPEAVVVEETDEDAFEELEDEVDEDATDEADDDTDEDTDEADDEESDDEDDDLEELEETEDDEAEEAPKTKAKAKGTTKAKTTKAKAEVPAFGSAELAAHITSTTGQAYDARSVRMLLRKLAKTEGSPLQRAIGEDRGRYSFSGPTDPAVKAIVQMVKSGEAQAIKREGLDKVKKDAEAKKAAKTEVVEEVEAAPVKTKKKAKATTTTAPAKATASKKKAKSNA